MELRGCKTRAQRGDTAGAAVFIVLLLYALPVRLIRSHPLVAVLVGIQQ